MPTLYPLMLAWCFITTRGNFSVCHCTAYHALLVVACEYMMVRNWLKLKKIWGYRSVAEPSIRCGGCWCEH